MGEPKLSLDAFLQFMKKGIGDRDLATQVALFLKKPNALGASKVLNWKEEGRGLPLTLLEGAAMLLLGRPELVSASVQAGQSAYGSALEAEASWHVYYITDKGEDEEDCHVWRFWKGVRNTRDEGQIGRIFLHSNMRIFKYKDEDVGPVGKPEMKLVPTHSPAQTPASEDEARTLMCQTVIEGTKPVDVGYWFVARKTMLTWAKEPPRSRGAKIYWEAMSALSAIPVRKVYLLASIPVRGHTSSLPLTLSFAPQITPLEFVEKLLLQEEALDALEDPHSEVRRYFDPWGVPGNSEYWRGRPEVPAVLLDSMKDRQEWVKEQITPLPTVATGRRRVYFKEFDQPCPLTYQTMLYKLPLAPKGKK